MTAVPGSHRPVQTLSDLYADRDLTDAQVRRLVALLGLAQWRGAASGEEPDDERPALPEAA
ncbi:hypothetical protein ACFY3G_35090 [Streptomyces phaeochromogenes]|uniref:hypothetical protein n=1 Tax=Streptomyces phaeochromogenes TaxID=1923 RepID=UPI0036AB4B7B